ncbi:MAG TPA: alpha/beta fold hydrolase [Chitinophagales bacterium]|nr:alpha/beta fold hydrolase [Chitinophagales bacterium]
MYVTKDRTFQNLHEYFDYIAETLGFPRVHEYFKSDWVISDGLKIHVDIYEYDPYAPTIVFIPGTAIYSLCYGDLLYELGQTGYNVVGFDPRGHGQSEGVRGDYTITEIMKDAENVITYAINRFNSKVSLMGSSQGGIVALYMAAKDERLNSVICQNFADLTAEETLQLARHPRLFKYLKLLIKRAGGIIPNAQIPITAYIDLDKIPVKYFGSAKNFMESDPLALKSVALRALQSLADTALPKPIEQIKVPVMVLQGTADSIFPVSYTQGIFDKLTCKKKFSLFPGKSHAVLHEDIEGVVPEVAGWLREIYHVDYQHSLNP